MSAAPHASQPRRPPRRVVGAVLAYGLAAVVAAACIVAPPPDLPSQPVTRPTILHDAVVPSADAIMTPAQVPETRVLNFLVPVVLDDPNEAFAWEAFVDYDPYTNPKPCASEKVEPTPGTLDGGTLVVPFSLAFNDANPPCNLVAASCHRIEFIVAYSFSEFHVPDSIGGDSVVWLYNGSGGTNSCLAFDASAFGEAGLPMSDAASDHLPIVPESGSDP